MSTWINWAALGKILGVGLLAGAGLPALFAVGLRLITPASAQVVAGPVSAIDSDERRAGIAARGLVAVVAGGLCFAVVLAALGYGIYLIVDG